MLARYHMKRGARTAELPSGTREDTRKHTRHVLRPTDAIVNVYLAHGDDAAWAKFERAYGALLKERFRKERERFDELAERAREGDVFIGCSCPTKKNPDVMRCHTVLALRFMKAMYPDLDVRFPHPTS